MALNKDNIINILISKYKKTKDKALELFNKAKEITEDDFSRTEQNFNMMQWDYLFSIILSSLGVKEMWMKKFLSSDKKALEFFKEEMNKKEIEEDSGVSSSSMGSAVTSSDIKVPEPISKAFKQKDEYREDGQIIIANLCKSFRKDTETCITGCIKISVSKGSTCPYADNDSEAKSECSCYK